MLSKKDAKLKVEQFKQAMAHMLNKDVLVCLGSHVFNMRIADLSIASVTALAIQPDKVYNEETGKGATPQVLEIRFETGESINIVIDDIEDFSVGIRSASFKIGGHNLVITYDS